MLLGLKLYRVVGMSIEYDEMANDRHQKVQAWLQDNVLIIPEPKAVTLHSFDVDWSDWSGWFRVKFDDFEFEDDLNFAIEITGRPKFYLPMFTSPLGVTASFSAIEITPKTHQAIGMALQGTFPRLKPFGRNRDTGIEITMSSSISDRISVHEAEIAKLLVVEGYTASVLIESL